MAAVSSSVCLSFGSQSIALAGGSTVHSLASRKSFVCTQLSPVARSALPRKQRIACIRAVKNDNKSGLEEARPSRPGLPGLLLPSMAALLIGGPFDAPEAVAEMTSGDYYQSLMESVKKNQATPPVVAPAIIQAPPLAATAVSSAASSQTTAGDDIDFSSLFGSSLFENTKKEASKITADADLRAKRVEEVAKKEKEAADKKAAEQRAQAEAQAKEASQKAEKEAQQKAKEVKAKQEAATKSSKTHGYLPLFIAQFLFFALYLGGIVLAFFLPESISKRIQATLNDLSARVGPLLEKATPVADQAVVAGSKLARQAQPYLTKAAQQAAPLAKKAVEAAKPLVSEAQVKAGEAVEKVNEKVKANQ